VLAVQLAQMARLLSATRDAGPPASRGLAPPQPFDLVEAGAGNGRLSADILSALAEHDPQVYAALRLHLVEMSAEARAAQPGTLGRHGERLASSSSSVPEFEGVLIANELLDAMPVHQVVMREAGLREIYVRPAEGAHRTGLATCEGPLSTPALAEYLSQLGVVLQPGWRAEINLRAVDWIRDVARRLQRGFLIVIDYGHEARELYSVTHSGGTLTTYSRHQSAGPAAPPLTPAWLHRPGEQDITAHVDFSSVRRAAEEEGAVTLGFLDQTYFVMGILEAAALSPARLSAVDAPRRSSHQSGSGRGWRHGNIEDRRDGHPRAEARSAVGDGVPGSTTLNVLNELSFKDRLALKTLIMPGGLGSTMKVLILGKGVRTPALACCSYRVRVT
jgi:SAM-dependent MidA family methyltransferase